MLCFTVVTSSSFTARSAQPCYGSLNASTRWFSPAFESADQRIGSELLNRRHAVSRTTLTRFSIGALVVLMGLAALQAAAQNPSRPKCRRSTIAPGSILEVQTSRSHAARAAGAMAGTLPAALATASAL